MQGRVAARGTGRPAPRFALVFGMVQGCACEPQFASGLGRIGQARRLHAAVIGPPPASCQITGPCLASQMCDPRVRSDSPDAVLDASMSSGKCHAQLGR